ncbi:MAG: Flp pilus assembly protein CpaB [Candidatus Binataceae bacterium]
MRRPIVLVLLAGLGAMVAAVLVYSALKKQDLLNNKLKTQNTQIVVASSDLPLGTQIEPSEVKMSNWPKDSVPEGAFTDAKQVLGSYVRNSFVANEPIVAPKLFIGHAASGVMPLLIPFGMRAVSVPVDEVSDIAGFVLPHTRVDILVSLSGNGSQSKPISKIVLQDVEVLAVAQEIERKKDLPTVVKTVTLLVSPHEAEELELASHEGTLRLAMRNYNDNRIVLTSGADLDQLLHSYSLQPDEPAMPPMPEPIAQAPAPAAAPAAAPRAVTIDILRNGKPSESVSFINQAPKGASHPEKTDRRQQQGKLSGGLGRPEAVADAIEPKPALDAERHSDGAAMLAGDAMRPKGGSIAAAARYVPTPKTIEVP